MFLDYYGIREQPFGVTPDPRFLYFGPSHREALASLYYGIETGRGFLALIAEPGMGKTTLLFHLLQKLRNSARTAFVFRTQCDSREFLRSLMADLGFGTKENDLVRMQEQLNVFLGRESRKGSRFVLVVDEAQNLADPVLETVRMLSNFETPRAKLMQILLAGQPQLADKLADPNLLQLRQRISVLSRLKRFSAAETSNYIAHRLLVAGYDGPPLFSRAALATIALRSHGIPRNINNLCFHALTLGFAQEQRTIGVQTVEVALADLELAPVGPEVMRHDSEVMRHEETAAAPCPEPRTPSLEDILAQLDNSRVAVSSTKAPRLVPESRPPTSRVATHPRPAAPRPCAVPKLAASPSSGPSADHPAGEIGPELWSLSEREPARQRSAQRSEAGAAWILWGPLISWFAVLGFTGIYSPAQPNSASAQAASPQTASAVGSITTLPEPFLVAVDRLQTAEQIGKEYWNKLTQKLREKLRIASSDSRLRVRRTDARFSLKPPRGRPPYLAHPGRHATLAKRGGIPSYEQEF